VLDRVLTQERVSRGSEPDVARPGSRESNLSSVNSIVRLDPAKVHVAGVVDGRVSASFVTSSRPSAVCWTTWVPTPPVAPTTSTVWPGETHGPTRGARLAWRLVRTPLPRPGAWG
jgi:hypothetical protein